MRALKAGRSRWDATSFGGQSALATGARATQAAAALGTTFILAFALGPGGLGKVERALNLPALLAPLAALSIAHGANLLRSDGVDRAGVSGASVVAGLVGTAVALVAFAVFAPSTGVGGAGLAAGAVLVIAAGTMSIGKALSWGAGDALASSFADARGSTMRLVAVVALWVVGSLDPRAAVVAIAAASALVAVHFVARHLRAATSQGRLRVSGADTSRLLEAALPMTLNIFLAGMLLRIDIALLAWFDVADADIGRYSISVRLAEVLWLVPLAMAQIFAVSAATSPESRARLALRLGSRSTAAAALVGLVIAGALALLVARFAPSYDGVGLLFLLLLPGIAAYAAVPTLRNLLVLENRARIGAVAAAGAVGANLALNAWLIPSHGVEGAAVATSISYGLLALAMFGLAAPTRPAA